jgi:serine protease Do
MGVALRDVDAEIERSLKLGVSQGAMVQDVTDGSPADRAGLRPYDVLVALEDAAIGNEDQLIREIAGRSPGSAVRLRLVRDGREQTTTVKLAERPPRDGPEARRENGGQAPDRKVETDGIPLGMNVKELDRQTLERLDLPRQTRGVLITRVEPMSSSFDSGIDRGTVLLEINRQRVESVADYRRIARAARPGDILTLWVYSPELVQRQLKTIRVEDR